MSGSAHAAARITKSPVTSVSDPPRSTTRSQRIAYRHAKLRYVPRASLWSPHSRERGLFIRYETSSFPRKRQRVFAQHATGCALNIVWGEVCEVVPEALVVNLDVNHVRLQGISIIARLVVNVIGSAPGFEDTQFLIMVI